MDILNLCVYFVHKPKKMQITSTRFKDLYIIEPNVFEDNRGYFFESFNLKKFEEQTGLKPNFVQDNQSQSAHGVIRGLHFQTPPMAQAKLVRVLSGKVLDVVVDLRKSEPTYGEVFTIELSDENKKQLFIPRGFAHGLSVLSETAEFFYKCDNYYSPENEQGIIFNDKDLDIDWKVPFDNSKLSEKDLRNFTWKNFKSSF